MDRFAPLSEVDARSLGAAWDRAFAPRSRDEREWRHAHGDGGAARLEAVVATREGAVQAFYGSLSQRGRVGGRAARLGQVVDSFVVPERRAGLGGARLLVECGLEHFRRHGGTESIVVHYGWPVEAALRVGVRHLGYLPLRREVVLYAETGAGGADGPEAARTVAEFDARHDRLWERLAAERPTCVDHDAAFLAWRVGEHPTRSYECLGVDDGGELAGLVVLGSGDALHPASLAVVDWLVPEGADEVARILLEAAKARARASGASLLLSIVPTHSRAFATLQLLGLRPHDSGRVLCARSFDPRLFERDLRSGLWTTLLDSDLV